MNSRRCGVRRNETQTAGKRGIHALFHDFYRRARLGVESGILQPEGSPSSWLEPDGIFLILIAQNASEDEAPERAYALLEPPDHFHVLTAQELDEISLIGLYKQRFVWVGCARRCCAQ